MIRKLDEPIRVLQSVELPNSLIFAMPFPTERKKVMRKRSRAVPRHTAEMGLVTKIMKLPWDMMRDCCKEGSSKGPRTKAKHKGAGS